MKIRSYFVDKIINLFRKKNKLVKEEIVAEIKEEKTVSIEEVIKFFEKSERVNISSDYILCEEPVIEEKKFN